MLQVNNLFNLPGLIKSIYVTYSKKTLIGMLTLLNAIIHLKDEDLLYCLIPPPGVARRH